jgi:hypothetical protein
MQRPTSRVFLQADGCGRTRREEWALASVTARLLWLRSCCAVVEGADVPLSHTMLDGPSPCPPNVCVAAVLGEALHRVSVLGGREGMDRSLGSVYGAAVTRFLGGCLRGVVSRVIDTPGVKTDTNGIAVSRDGAALFVADFYVSVHAIHVISVADGSTLREVGDKGHGFVFVADYKSDRVQVLSPDLSFDSLVGVGQLQRPVGVCANADVVVVSEGDSHRVSVFSRSGRMVARFGCHGSGDGELASPFGLCFASGDRRVAVAEYCNSRVSVFGIHGEFIRHVGVGVLKWPQGVACSAFDELVVGNVGYDCLCVFSDAGELLKTFGVGSFTAIAIHGRVVFAASLCNECIVEFE